MKNVLLSLCGFVVALTASGGVYDAATSFNWSATTAGTTVTIPAGVQYLAAEADIGYVNALGALKFGDADSAVVFTSTTAPAVTFQGPGTVVKDSAATWTLSRVQTDTTFTGNWDILGGTVNVGSCSGNNSTLFPSLSAWRRCDVRAGATLVYDCAANFPCVAFHLAGTLLVAAQSGASSFQKFVIEGDNAVIEENSGKYIYLSSAGADAENMDLNGHKVTCRLKNQYIYAYKGYVKGPGVFRLENGGNVANVFMYLRENALGFTDPSVTVELGDTAGIQIGGHPKSSMKANLVVEGVGKLEHQHWNSSATCPQSPEETGWDGLFWDGTVNLKNSSSVLTMIHGVSGTHWGIRGKISGPGSIVMTYNNFSHVADYYVSNPENDLTGSITIKKDTLHIADGAFPNTADLVVTLTGTAEISAGATLAAKSVSSGDSNANHLTLGDGATFTALDIPTSCSGSLTLALGEGATFLCPGQAGNDCPSWLRPGSLSYYFGTGVGQLYGTAVQITTSVAGGGVIPDSASAVVGVTGGDPITLAAANTTVTGISMRDHATPATLALGVNNLTVGTLYADPDVETLTVGAADDTGKLASSSGTLTLNSASEKPLVVRAPLDSSITKIVKTGDGEADLASPGDYAGTLDVKAGKLGLCGSFGFSLGNDSMSTRMTFSGGSGTPVNRRPAYLLKDGFTLEAVKNDQFYYNYGRIIVGDGGRLEIPDDLKASESVRRPLDTGRLSAIEIEDGGYVDCRFSIQRGVIRQNGGTFKASCAGAGTWVHTCFLNEGVYGALMVNGGLADIDNNVVAGYGENSFGVFEQTGGTFNVHDFNLGYSAGSAASARFRDGAASFASLKLPGSSGTSAAAAVVQGIASVEGNAAVSAGTVLLGGGSYNAKGTLVVRDGGTVEAGSFSKASGDTLYGELVLDGGTVKASQTDTSLFGTGGTALNAVTVRAGGATIEVPSGLSVMLDVPLGAPAAGCVASIPMPTTRDNLPADLIAPPGVRIDGDGHGAAAFVDWNDTTRTHSGVAVVSGGSGYTTATATFNYDGTIITKACEISTAAQSSGSFTKAGDGLLGLNVANTYGGDTVLKGGTLKANVAGAIPADSTVVLAGGRLEVANGVALPLNYRIDATNGYTVAGSLAFPQGAQLTLENLDQIDDDTRPHRLLTCDQFSGTATITNGDDLPKCWFVSFDATGIRLGKVTGLVIHFK